MSQIIDASTRALQQQAATTTKTIGQLAATLDGQVSEIQANQNTIADQKITMEANKAEIETQVREAKAEIRLQVKEDADSVLSDLLGARGLISLKPSEVEDLEDRALTAERDAAKQVEAAVKTTESKLHSQYGSKISEINAENKVQLATFTANAARDADLIDALRKQVAGLEKTIDANREAETARTTALANSSVTVNNGK